MNEFLDMFDDKINKIKFRDTLSWEKDKEWFHDYMIYETPTKQIGLINLHTTKIYNQEFSSLEELEQHFRKKTVDRNRIIITDGDEWSVYVP